MEFIFDTLAFSGPCFCEALTRFRLLIAINVLRLSEPGTADPPAGNRSGLAGGRNPEDFSAPVAAAAEILRADKLSLAGLFDTGLGIRNCWPPGAGSRVLGSFNRKELVLCSDGVVATAKVGGSTESPSEPSVEDFEDAEDAPVLVSAADAVRLPTKGSLDVKVLLCKYISEMPQELFNNDYQQNQKCIKNRT